MGGRLRADCHQRVAVSLPREDGTDRGEGGNRDQDQDQVIRSNEVFDRVGNW